MDNESVNKIIEKVLESFPAIFLIDKSWFKDNSLKITIDGDDGCTIKDCVAISREIQKEMEEQGIDVSLEVSSPDASKPLTHTRQYAKHIGRDMDIITQTDKKITGQLKKVDETGLVLAWEERVPKEIGKGKQTIAKEENILFNDIKEAKVALRF